jgi:outer membrane biosynthesis protein TonB
MFRAVVRREGFRKSTLILGGALSAAVHLFLAAAVLLPLSGAPMIARADLDGTPPVLTLDDPSALSVPTTPPPVPQPNTAALDDAPVAAAPAPQAPVRRPRRPPPLPPPPPDPTSELPPVSPPPAAPKSTLLLAAATTQIVGQPPRAAPAASTRPYLSPGVAAGLRIYDNFPRMPEPLRGPGAQYLVMADVCVSERGVVDRVRVSAPAGAAALEHALTDAIRTWRYRPLMTGGGPSPFCHMVNMRYALE